MFGGARHVLHLFLWAFSDVQHVVLSLACSSYCVCSCATSALGFTSATQPCIQMAGGTAIVEVQQNDATEHFPIVEVQQSGAVEHFGIGATEHVPIVEVAFAHGKWWSIPQDMSAQLYEKYANDEDAGYTWDWGEGGRPGYLAPNGELTSINCYTIDFVNRVQTNLDSQSKRSIRVVWVRPQDVEARFVGKLPPKRRRLS